MCVGWVLGYCKKDLRINECGIIVEYLNLLELLLMQVYHIRLVDAYCYVDDLCYESNCVIYLFYDLNLFCYNLCKNDCDSFFIFVYLLIIVIICGIFHVDAKELIDLGSVICDLIFAKSNPALPDLPSLF